MVQFYSPSCQDARNAAAAPYDLSIRNQIYEENQNFIKQNQPIFENNQNNNDDEQLFWNQVDTWGMEALAYSYIPTIINCLFVFHEFDFIGGLLSSLIEMLYGGWGVLFLLSFDRVIHFHLTNIQKS